MGHREIRLVDRKTVVNEQVEVQDAGTPVDFAAFTAAAVVFAWAVASEPGELGVSDWMVVEQERIDIAPKLQRLRDIKRDTDEFLREKSDALQDRLVISFKKQVDGIDRDIPDAVARFGDDEFVVTVDETGDRRLSPALAAEKYSEDPAAKVRREAAAEQRTLDWQARQDRQRRPDKRQRRQIVKFKGKSG